MHFDKFKKQLTLTKILSNFPEITDYDLLAYDISTAIRCSLDINGVRVYLFPEIFSLGLNIDNFIVDMRNELDKCASMYINIVNSKEVNFGQLTQIVKDKHAYDNFIAGDINYEDVLDIVKDTLLSTNDNHYEAMLKILNTDF